METIELMDNSSNVNNKGLENNENEKGIFDNILGKAINAATDMAIKAALPDFLEDQVIKIKDNLIENGLIDGIKKTIEEIVDFGKDTIDLVKGKTKDISKMQEAIEENNIIENASELWDYAIDKAKDEGIIKTKIAKVLYKGKDTFIEALEKAIKETIEKQNQEQKNKEVDHQLSIITGM